ncbi:MAG: nuclear transport factor 2 family protein [Rhodospirillaceae bacterium]
MSSFPEMLERFKHAVEQCDVEAFKALFTEDAVYEDQVYGAFKGHAELERMLRDVFHEDATGFLWEFDEPLCDGDLGYVHYRFSLKPSHPKAAGGRALLEGCARFTLRDGRFSSYREWGNVAGTLHQSGVPDNVVMRFVKRQADALREKPEMAGHVKGK